MIRGRKWSERVEYSRSLIVLVVLFHLKWDPLFSSWNIIKLKIPVKIIPIREGIKLLRPCLMIDENIINSPMALGRGGRPRFAAAKINQRVGNRRNKLFRPRLTRRVRDPVRS